MLLHNKFYKAGKTQQLNRIDGCNW